MKKFISLFSALIFASTLLLFNTTSINAQTTCSPPTTHGSQNPQDWTCDDPGCQKVTVVQGGIPSTTCTPVNLTPTPSACQPTTCNLHGTNDTTKWTCDDSACHTSISAGRGGQSCTCIPGSGVSITPFSSKAQFCDAPANTKLYTALGCIPVNSSDEFIKWLLGWAIGVAGGIAMLLIVIAGFNIMTASGDPQKLNGGRELLTAAVSGLILIIFSVFLLKLIGVDILHLPGF